jgi:hypothetical protein
LFVVYDRARTSGYWAWITDLVSSQEIADASCKTTTLRVPVASSLNEAAWQAIRSDVTLRYEALIEAGRQLESLRGLLQAVRSLGRALQLLQMSPLAKRRSEDEMRLARLGDALAHRAAVRALTTFAGYLPLDSPLRNDILMAAAAYRAHCEEFIHPFSELMNQKDQPVAFSVNEDRMREMRPMLAFAITSAIHELAVTSGSGSGA